MPIWARLFSMAAAAGALLGGGYLLARQRLAQQRRRADAAEARAASYLKLLEANLPKGAAAGSSPAASPDPLPAMTPRRVSADSRYLFVSFEEEIQRARQRGTSLTLLTLSLDNSSETDGGDGKSYDRLLRAVALAVRGQLRGCDTCIRYASDEFILILPGVARDEARRVEARLRVAVHGVRYESRAVAARLARARLGSATFPEDGGSFDQLLTLADARRLQDGVARRDRPAATAPADFRIPSTTLSRN